MSNRLYFESVSPTGTTITIPDYPAVHDFPTSDQIKFRQTLDGAINIQRRITDDREIRIVFENVKEREEILSGTAASGGSSTVFNTDLTDYIDDSFNGYYIKFTSGALSGEEKLISDFAQASGTVTAAAFTGAPGNDSFTIYRIASWVDTLKAQRYVLTGLQFNMSIEDGNDFDYLPASSTTVIIFSVTDDEVLDVSIKQIIKRVVLVLRKVPT